MSSSKTRMKAKTARKRPQRATSNVFAMFDQSQIQEFKEAFNMIDQNRDGFVDKEDLHDMLASLGNFYLVSLSVPCTLFMYTIYMGGEKTFYSWVSVEGVAVCALSLWLADYIMTVVP